jgi:hypothetical protein
LILIVANAGGTDSTFVVDYNLTRQDCYRAAFSWSGTLDQYSTVQCVIEGRAA